jgi:predicted O-methyltransferase YrrM
MSGLPEKAGKLLLRSPVPARHWEHSLIFSADDDAGPSPRLLETGLGAAEAARRISLDQVGARIADGLVLTDVWPGEHYRLLAGLVEVMQPTTVIEIGTASGLSALALLEKLPSGGRVATFDLVPWREVPDNVLTEADFAGGRLVQFTDDLSYPDGVARHRELLEAAELVFIDAAKDGAQERRFLAEFEKVAWRRPPIVVFDDVRQWKMLAIWREIKRPKLDLTSFGHWTGTGLVDFAP